jgi:hypothetical protein
MTPRGEVDPTKTDAVDAVTLVWLDATVALVVCLRGKDVRVERLQSDVPAHRRATGHVRHDPSVRHGGGRSQSAGEPHRTEHLNRFIGEIAKRLATSDDVLILGPGTVHERLAGQLAKRDRRRRATPTITCVPSGPMTDRQLITRARRFAGAEPRRRTVGAYRWGESSGHAPSDRPRLPPCRVVGKRREDRAPAA